MKRHLLPQDVAAIVARYATGDTAGFLATEYGVSLHTMDRIVRRVRQGGVIPFPGANEGDNDDGVQTNKLNVDAQVRDVPQPVPGRSRR